MRCSRACSAPGPSPSCSISARPRSRPSRCTRRQGSRRTRSRESAQCSSRPPTRRGWRRSPCACGSACKPQGRRLQSDLTAALQPPILGPGRPGGSNTVQGAATRLESQPQEARAASCGTGSKEAGALPAAGAQALCVVLALLVAREALLRTAARVRALLHRAGALRRRRRARRGEALVVPLAFDAIRRVTPVHALGVPVVVLVAMEAGGDATTRRAALLPVLGALRSRGQLGAIPPCAVSPNLIDT